MKVLNIIGSMDLGGAETMVMNMLREYRKDENITFDFFVSEKKENYYEKEIIASKQKIFKTSKKTKNPFKFCIDLVKVLKQKKYDVVHVHASNSLAFLPLLIAKILGVKVRVAHSHTSNSSHGLKYRIFHNIFKSFLNRTANVKISCSESSARWLFGSSYKKVLILPNPIDTDRFTFNEKKRIEIRNELHIDQSSNVIIHVGRFAEVKNHSFLIEVFKEFLKKQSDSYLILVGDGEEKNKIKKVVDKYNLNEKIKFVGLRNDVENMMSASDIFLFPSLYEGMPLSIIEAQSSGLPCYISNGIEKNNMINNELTTIINLELSAVEWATIIELNYCYSKNKKINRLQYSKIIGEKNGSAKVSQQLLSIYS